MARRSARFRPTWVIATTALLVCAGLLAFVLPPSGHKLVPGDELAAGTNFALSGTVSGLTPGVNSNLVLTATNPFNVPITVTSLTVSVPTPPASCPLSNLTIDSTAFSGSPSSVTLGLSQLVPASGSANLTPSASDGMTTATSTTISSATLFTTASQYNGWSITDSAGAFPAGTTIVAETAGAGHSATLSQTASATKSGDAFTLAPSILVAKAAPNGCQVTTFNFNYGGSASYTEPTLTTLTSAPNPSGAGQSVTFSATVAGNITPTTSVVTPVGSVIFYECTNPANLASGSPASSCTASTALSPAETVNASGVATYATTTLPFGSDVIFAVFTATDPTSFATSSSKTLTQLVTAGNCESTLPTTAATKIITGSYSGNYTVAAGTSLWLDGGTISGNLTIAATGEFTASGGKVAGNITSSGGPVSLQGTTVSGNISTSGGLALGASTKVSGNVTVSAGTTLCISGTSSGTVTISGNLQVESLSATSNPVNICNTKLSGNLTFSGNAAPAFIGGSSGCLGNTISGNFLVEDNTGKVTIGGSGTGYGNTASGNITVSGNTGGTLSDNAANGNCALSGDKPGIVGSANTAKGKNTCNGTA